VAGVAGKVALITGAGSGIGRTTALVLAKGGADVALCDVNLAGAETTAREVSTLGRKALALRVDVTRLEEVEQAVARTQDTFGRVDILFSNAGIAEQSPFTEITEAQWDQMFSVHLNGTYNCFRAVLPGMLERNWGRLISTSSMGAFTGGVRLAHYCAAKAGIAAFTVITAQELGRYGVTVNAIAPTALTRMTEDLMMMSGLTDEQKDALGPDSISPLVVWLGCKESASVTGRVFGIFGPKISVAEGWVYGPSHDSGTILAPGEPGEVIPDLVKQAAANASMFGSRD